MDMIGLRSAAGFEELSERLRGSGAEAVIMDASRVFGRYHVISAWEHAERSFRNGTNRSRTMVTEFLLYMAGERQISKALDIMRPKGNAYVIFFPEGLRGQDIEGRDDALIEGRPEEAVAAGLDTGSGIPPEDLALEMVAMVDILKG